MVTKVGTAVAILLVVLVSVCSAGEDCITYSGFSTKYCAYGCCGYNNQDCCSGPIGLIVGLCVGGAVFIIAIIVIICVCRRRRYGGFIYGSQAQPTVVVQQSSMATQNGVVQPGVTYPPYPQYQYQYPADAYPANAPYPGAPSAPMQAGAGYPPQPMHHGHGPPKYDSY